MIQKIALKNFMSHIDTVLELGPGLNVITGPNNCGKSAIVAAIQLVCRNHLTGEVVVRHGSKECSVTIWTDDQHEITWKRKGKEVSYTIDGTEYSRLKGKVPEILHEILKLPEIEEGDQSFDLHFGLQKEPIFLLDETGSKAAKFFASSSDAARLIQMQSLHRSRNTNRKATLKLLREQSDDLAVQIEQLSPVVELRQSSDALVAQYESIQAKTADNEEMSNRLIQIKDHFAQLVEDQQRLSILGQLPEWPEFVSTDDLEDWLTEYSSTHSIAEYLSKRRSVLEDLSPPPLVEDTNRLATAIQQLESMSRTADESNARLCVLSSLQQPPGLKNVRELQLLIAQLRKEESKYEKLSSRHALLGKLVTPPELVDQTLSSKIEILKSTVMLHQQHEAHVRELEKSQHQVQQEIKQWLRKHPECPVCHRQWDYEQAMSREAHQHG